MKKIIRLTERDLTRIVKLVLKEDITGMREYRLNESKISFDYCFNNYPEWLSSESTEIGAAATTTSTKNSLWKKIKTGITYPVGNCEGLKNNKFNAGFLSNITNFNLKEKAIKKTVEFCMRHLDEVLVDLKSTNIIKKKKHIKPSFISSFPKDGITIDQWINDIDSRNKDIKNIEKTKELLYNTKF